MLRPLHPGGRSTVSTTVFHRIEMHRISKYDTQIFRVRGIANKAENISIPYDTAHHITAISSSSVSSQNKPREYVAGANLHLTTTPPLAKFRPRNEIKE